MVIDDQPFSSAENVIDLLDLGEFQTGV